MVGRKLGLDEEGRIFFVGTMVFVNVRAILKSVILG
jgi:hypothetical protein